jgi:ComF family protein
MPRLCLSCRKAPLQIDGIRAVGYLEGTLRTAIHRFKYSNIQPLAIPLGQLMAQYLLQNQLPVEVVVPVPLHAQRLKERGYNQAALLAQEITKTLGLPLLENALSRVKSTVPQVGLGARERRDNVRGAFHCADGRLKEQRVLLIDDVCTTGATLEACSLALRESGVSAVWGLVLARERWREPEKGG